MSTNKELQQQIEQLRADAATNAAVLAEGLAALTQRVDAVEAHAKTIDQKAGECVLELRQDINVLKAAVAGRKRK